MSTYVMSDIHGCYGYYEKMLKKIHFADADTLFVLGDVIDRGTEGIRILQDMMMRPNVIPILGNHEYMMMLSTKFLLQEITEESVAAVSKDPEILQGLSEWINVGGSPTISEITKLSVEEREDMLDYLGEFSILETVEVNGNEFVMVHAGLSDFDRNRDLMDYKLHEVLFQAPNYEMVYFEDKYLVTGHLPTRAIRADGELTKIAGCRDEVYMKNNHIAIDCGCGYDGRLACVRLDDLKVFYVGEQEKLPEDPVF